MKKIVWCNMFYLVLTGKFTRNNSSHGMLLCTADIDNVVDYVKYVSWPFPGIAFDREKKLCSSHFNKTPSCLLHNVCNIELMKWNCLNSGCQRKHIAKYVQMRSSVGILEEKEFVKSMFTHRTQGNLFWEKFEEGVFTNHLKFTVLMYHTVCRF